VSGFSEAIPSVRRCKDLLTDGSIVTFQKPSIPETIALSLRQANNSDSFRKRCLGSLHKWRTGNFPKTPTLHSTPRRPSHNNTDNFLMFPM